jgi:hypothetical protein
MNIQSIYKLIYEKNNLTKRESSRFQMPPPVALNVTVITTERIIVGQYIF